MNRLPGLASNLLAITLALLVPACASDIGTTGRRVNCFENTAGTTCTEQEAPVDLDDDGVEDTLVCSDIEDADDDSDGVDDDADSDDDGDGIADDADSDDDGDGTDSDADSDDDNDGIGDDDDCDELDDDDGSDDGSEDDAE